MVHILQIGSNLVGNKKKFVLSRFFIKIIYRDKVLLFHTFFLNYIIVDMRISEKLDLLKDIGSFNKLDLIKILNNTLLINLLQLNHFINEINTENQIISKCINEAKIDFSSFKNLRLVLTTKCNFKCKYCTIDSIKKKEIDMIMDYKTAKKAIDIFFINHEKKNLSKSKIVLYGGEPLLEKKLIVKIIKYIREIKKSSISITIITNGSLISENLCKFFQKYEIKISISIDGLEKSHNEMRVFPNGRGTFKDVLNGIHNLSKYDIQYGCSCTIGRHNINNLTEIISFFKKRCGINYGLFNYIQFGANHSQSAKKMAKKMIEIFEIKAAEGFTFNGVFLIIDKIINKNPKIHFCYGCGDMLAIMPNGDIALCHRLGIDGITTISNVFKRDALKIIKDSRLYQNLLNRTPFNMSECKNCECIGICGAGCYLNAYKKSGNLFKRDPEYCNYIKTILSWILKKIIINAEF